MTSIAVLFPVCCQITLDFLWLQNNLISIRLHQWIVMTEKTEKSNILQNYLSMIYFEAVEQMLHHA